MSNDNAREFVSLYHAAVIEAIGKDADTINVKIGIHLANHFLKQIGKMPESEIEFKEAIETFFKRMFPFAEIAQMTFNQDGTAVLYVKGCMICHGNSILRSQGGKGYCPVCHLVKSSLAKGLKKRIELTGTEKPGPVGECFLKYKAE